MADEACINETVAESEPKWQTQQRRTFGLWVDAQLESIGEIKLVVDLRLEKRLMDGVTLPRLMESLSKKKILKTNRQKQPKTQVARADNVFQAMSLIEEEGMKVIGIDVNYILVGNTKMILALVWTLIKHYQLRSFRKSSIDMTPITNSDPSIPAEHPLEEGQVEVVEHAPNAKQLTESETLLLWINSVIAPLSVKNFTSDWRNGEAFRALLNDLNKQKGIPLLEQGAEAHTIFAEAATQHKIPQLIEAGDLEALDSKSAMLYISYFHKTSQALQQLSIEKAANTDDQLLIEKATSTNDQLSIEKAASTDDQLIIDKTVNTDDQLPIEKAANKDDQLPIEKADNKDDQLPIEKAANKDDQLPIEKAANKENSNLTETNTVEITKSSVEAVEVNTTQVIIYVHKPTVVGQHVMIIPAAPVDFGEAKQTTLMMNGEEHKAWPLEWTCPTTSTLYNLSYTCEVDGFGRDPTNVYDDHMWKLVAEVTNAVGEAFSFTPVLTTEGDHKSILAVGSKLIAKWGHINSLKFDSGESKYWAI